MDTHTKFPLSVSKVCRSYHLQASKWRVLQDTVGGVELQFQGQIHISIRLEEGVLPPSVGPSKVTPAVCHLHSLSQFENRTLRFPSCPSNIASYIWSCTGEVRTYYLISQQVHGCIMLTMQMSQFLYQIALAPCKLIFSLS